MNLFITWLQAIILSAITISIPFVGAWLVKVVVLLYKYLTTKYGTARTNQIASEALKVWNNIEEETRLGDLVGNKYNEFMSRMSVKFPLLSSARIIEFNKNIAGEFNKDKAVVIKVIDPTNIPVEVPVIIYYDPLTGIKLAPGILPVMPVA